MKCVKRDKDKESKWIADDVGATDIFIAMNLSGHITHWWGNHN